MPHNQSRNESAPSDPEVSIITPVLNGGKYLEVCIQSVLNQTYSNIEHIFVDGNSTDGTLEILAAYQTKYPERIRFVSEPDKSPEEGWNRGLRLATGDIFGWLGADDFYEPDAIQTIVNFFKANPSAFFVFGECNHVEENGAIMQRTHFTDFDLNEAIKDRADTPAPSSFYKRAVIEKAGYVNTHTRISELDLWIRVGKKFRIHHIDKVLCNFRVHPGGFSGSAAAHRAFVRDGCFISIRYGWNVFSPRAKRYYQLLWFQTIDALSRSQVPNRLRPVFGWSYPVLNNLLGRLFQMLFSRQKGQCKKIR